MGGSVRNKQLLRIAAILSIVLLVAYMFFSWQSDVKSYKEKAAAASVEYQDLLTKFNKLTEELKNNVQRAAETRHDLETAQKSHEVEATKREEQVKRCMGELRTYKTKAQSMESERDRIKSEKELLEQQKLSVDSEVDRLTGELDEVKVAAVKDKEAAETCTSDLKDVKAQLLSAQTDSLGASQRNQACQAQLTTAQEAFESCETKVTTLETDIHNKVIQIQQLQDQNNLLKQQQQANERPVRNGMKQPLSDHGFNDVNVVDSQKQKTLIDLEEKLKKGHVLSKQEQKVLQMLSEDTGKNSHISTAKKKITLSNNDEQLKKEQQAPPPQPGDSPQLNHADEEQVQDLLDEKNKKDTLDNLDMKEDEGGADGGDGGDQQEGNDYPQDEHEGLADNYGRGGPEGGREDGGKENEEDNPLPDPVGKREANVEFPDKGDPEDEDMLNDPHGHLQFKKDQEVFQKELRNKRPRMEDIRKKPRRGLR